MESGAFASAVTLGSGVKWPVGVASSSPSSSPRGRHRCVLCRARWRRLRPRREILQTRASADDGELSHDRPQHIVLLPVSVSSGGDVLFPGAVSRVRISDRVNLEAVEAARHQALPRFGHFYVDAAGEMSPVGTKAIVVDREAGVDEEGRAFVVLTCMGGERLRLVETLKQFPYRSALVGKYFDDRQPDPAEDAALRELEHEVLQAMQGVIKLSMHLTQPDEELQNMLNLASQRLEHFSSAEGRKRYLEDWDDTLGVEIVSFVLADLIDQPIYQRRRLLLLTDTRERLEYVLGYLEPQRAELAAKAALYDAIG